MGKVRFVLFTQYDRECVKVEIDPRVYVNPLRVSDFGATVEGGTWIDFSGEDVALFVKEDLETVRAALEADKDD